MSTETQERELLRRLWKASDIDAIDSPEWRDAVVDAGEFLASEESAEPDARVLCDRCGEYMKDCSCGDEPEFADGASKRHEPTPASAVPVDGDELRKLLTSREAVEEAMDFLDAWRFCPVSRSDNSPRACLEDAAGQFLAAVAARLSSTTKEQSDAGR